MSEPIPTPFDITDIPHIAWEPGAVAWIALLTAVAVLAGALGISALLARQRSPERALADLLRQLSEVCVTSPGLECERFSRLSRRIFSFLVGLDLSGLTAQELRALASATEDPHESEILAKIATIEECSYAPAGVPQAQLLPQLSQQTREALSSFAAARRRR